jgi:hypothetical protein
MIVLVVQTRQTDSYDVRRYLDTLAPTESLTSLQLNRISSAYEFRSVGMDLAESRITTQRNEVRIINS